MKLIESARFSHGAKPYRRTWCYRAPRPNGVIPTTAGKIGPATRVCSSNENQWNPKKSVIRAMDRAGRMPAGCRTATPADAGFHRNQRPHRAVQAGTLSAGLPLGEGLSSRQWSDADYTRMFTAMAAGIRAGDPRLKIATCNLTTGNSGDYEKSVACLAGHSELVDVLTVLSSTMRTRPAYTPAPGSPAISNPSPRFMPSATCGKPSGISASAAPSPTNPENSGCRNTGTMANPPA